LGYFMIPQNKIRRFWIWQNGFRWNGFQQNGFRRNWIEPVVLNSVNNFFTSTISALQLLFSTVLWNLTIWPVMNSTCWHLT